MERITEADLFAAIEEYVNQIPEKQKEPGTIRTGEVIEQHGISRGSAQKILGKMAADGRLEKAMVWFVDDWGKKQRTAGYRIKGSD